MAMVIVLIMAAFLTGCTTDKALDLGDDAGVTPTGFGDGDLKARGGGPSRFNAQYGGNQQTRPGEIYSGSDQQARNSPSQPGIMSSDDGYQLNFEGADVAAVVKSVLGDVLQANYSIDPRITGQISLSSARPIPKASLVSVLETALKGVNAAIVRNGPLYRVVPSSEGIGSGNLQVAAASNGYGVTVIPVKHVSVATLARLMENFVTNAGAIRSDPATGLVLVMGTVQERQAALDAAGVIDTDIMRSQSVGIFPLANSSPESVVSEMQKIAASGEGGWSQGQIQFQPMERMNAVLVIARSADTLKSASKWIGRLDRLDPETAGIKVYRLRYTPAAKVATMLNEIFSNSAGSAAGTSDQSALQPTSTTAGLSSSLSQTSSSTSTDQTSTSTNSSLHQTSGAAGIDTAASAFATGPGANASSSANPQSASTSSSMGASGIRVAADTINNSLLIHAEKSQYRFIEAAIRQIDQPPEQVAIEATIAEVVLSNKLQYGVQAYLQSSDVGLGTNKGSGGLTTSTSSPLISAVVPGANLILGTSTTPRVILNALNALTNVKILSSPSLVVLDNQTATLQVGNQVAIKTQSSQSTDTATSPVINNITYKDTGIILNVSPRIGANGLVTLEIQQEISNVVDNSGGSDGLTPTISQRRVKSSIAVPDGQTVMLAGLISSKANKGRSGLPGSQKWGLLGDIFSSHDNTTERNELVIFIKPKIIHDQFDAQAAAEEFRSRLGALNSAYQPPRR
jgi:general secretion pathway protein D